MAKRSLLSRCPSYKIQYKHNVYIQFTYTIYSKTQVYIYSSHIQNKIQTECTYTIHMKLKCDFARKNNLTDCMEHRL